MGRFLDEEKQRYVDYKASTGDLPEDARAVGVYRKKSRPFCLPGHLAEFNLFDGIREDVQDYFEEYEIKWHDGKDGKPSNHLCDSQVCCVNFLYPFSHRPEALASLFRRMYPTIGSILKIGPDGRYVAHEWNGAQNYLGERVPGHGRRTRGANFTSADAAVFFEHNDGTRQFVLIEWKYTETYSPVDLHYSHSGTDRTEIYRHLYDQEDFPLHKDLVGEFKSLFFEPFYQLMRQQLLANEMEKAGELAAHKVSLLHLAPAANPQFNRVTSPSIMQLGDSVVEIWKRLVKDRSHFHSASVEDLFGKFDIASHPEMRPWWDYAGSRYPWFRRLEDNT